MLESFFIFGDLPPNVEKGVYQFPLVVLSYIVASFASYTALSLAQQLVNVQSKTRERMFLHWGGAIAMGAGIWSMHFIGMLSYKMRMVVEYDPFLTFLSLLLAIIASYGALEIASRKRLTALLILTSGVLMGIGICSMHYTGMAAMTMDGTVRYIPSFFLLSLLIAIAASIAAIWIAFVLAQHRNIQYHYLLQIAAALIMGAAICGMHYTGMLASVFVPYADCRFTTTQDLSSIAWAIAGITSLILGLALATGIYKKIQIDRQLQNSKAWLAAIVESSDDAIISKTLDGIITSWNAGAQRLFGYTAEEAIGQPINLIIPPDRLEEEHQIITKLRAGEATNHFETVRLTKNDRLVDVSLTISPVRDKAGHVVGISKIAHDITERKAFENEMKRSNKELERFAYVASHDLKTPLRGIDTLAKWVIEDMEGALTEDSLKNLNLLRSRVVRLEKLLEGILSYSRAGRAEETPESVDTKALVQAVADLHIPDSFTVLIGDLPSLVTFRTALEQIFGNLFSNAVKHHDRKNGLITVMAKRTGRFYEFIVQDDGPGIKRAFHEKVFEMFQTIKPRDQVEGSGLGMSIIRKLVEWQGGTVWIESEDEKRGTAIHFLWPLEFRSAKTN